MHGNLPLITVVVCVYNLEDYVSRCIECVCAQSYRNLEIIIVDDGSVDDSGAICDKYARSDKRIRVIHKFNKGLSAARNDAIEIARGKYITFIDGDDYIDYDMIEHLYYLITGKLSEGDYTNLDIPDMNRNVGDIDIAVCNYAVVDEKEILQDIVDKSPKEYNYCVKAYGNTVGLMTLLYQRDFTVTAWAKLYKTALFEDIRYPIGKLHEDMGTTYKLFMKATKSVYSSAKKYNYVVRHNSIVNSQFTPKRMDYINLSKEMLRDIKFKRPECYNAAVSRHFSACFQVLALFGAEERSKYPMEYKRLLMEIHKYKKQVLKDPYVRSINKYGAFISMISPETALWIAKHVK